MVVPMNHPGDKNVTTRFAPSPNGLLHMGHAYSALFSARLAQDRGGRFVLRIEDIDTTRAREEHVRAIAEDLRWLGLRWQEPMLRQSRNMAAYKNALNRLHELDVLYPCTCSRKDIRRALAGKPDWPCDPDGAPLYPGTCKGQDIARDDVAWRLDMQKALRVVDGPLTWREEGAGPGGERGVIPARPQDWGDVILARRDIGVSYHIAVVVDDAAQGITHVTRGQDLFHASAIHRLLQVLLGLPEPVYVHHRLITGEDGRKLSKSLAATSLRALREAGMSAGELKRRLGF